MSLSRYKYRLLIAYDGTSYHGWQIQPTGISIQELIQKALFTILREEVKVIGAGRTDAGVHAKGQVAHFSCSHILDIPRFLRSVNGLIPRDIRVLRAEQVPLSFHAQHSACRKTYFYHLHLDTVQDPFRRLYSLHIHNRLNLEMLQVAACCFVGTFDFTAFANEGHKGSVTHNAIRTIYRVDVVQEPGGVRLEFEGEGFLYKMVRNIVGVLLEVASGKRPIEDIEKIFSSRDRRCAASAAPPHGLFLMHVDYENLSSH
jgi:tRNA pseudouridine38-40 synthase